MVLAQEQRLLGLALGREPARLPLSNRRLLKFLGTCNSKAGSFPNITRSNFFCEAHNERCLFQVGLFCAKFSFFFTSKYLLITMLVAGCITHSSSSCSSTCRKYRLPQVYYVSPKFESSKGVHRESAYSLIFTS